LSQNRSRALVFDLDGTLIDSAPDLHSVLATLMGEQSLPPPTLPAVRDMIGDGAQVLVRRAFAAANVDLGDDRIAGLTTRFVELYSAAPCRLTTVYPGVALTLRGLREDGWWLGLCTNKPQVPTELILQTLGLSDLFASVLGGDRIERRKPQPEHVLAVLNGLGVPPDDALLVGDSRNDVLAAHSAGLPCILVSYGYSAVRAAELGAELTIDQFGDLPAALASIGKRPVC
jgi:phosphoglycolate phosphatase